MATEEVRLIAITRARVEEIVNADEDYAIADAWDAGIPLDELPDDLRRRVDAEG